MTPGPTSSCQAGSPPTKVRSNSKDRDLRHHRGASSVVPQVRRTCPPRDSRVGGGRRSRIRTGRDGSPYRADLGDCSPKPPSEPDLPIKVSGAPAPLLPEGGTASAPRGMTEAERFAILHCVKVAFKRGFVADGFAALQTRQGAVVPSMRSLADSSYGLPGSVPDWDRDSGPGLPG